MIALEKPWSKYSSEGKQVKRKMAGPAQSPEQRIIKNQNAHLYKQ